VNVNVDARKATGGAGNDTFDFIPTSLVGSQSADQLACSTAAPSVGCFVDGGAGNDTITGGPGNDTLRGGSGDDHIVGNGGNDTVDYTTGGAVNVNLATGHATGQGTDTLTGISSVQGSPNNDTLVGPAQTPCALHGNAGDDHLSATANGCVFDGGDGNDTITGSPGGDFIAAGAGNDTVNAGAGNDWVFGDTGNDHLDGGTGTDLLDYSPTAVPLVVDLSKGTVSGLGTDTATNFENFNSGQGDDVIFATDGPNVIHGNLGDDKIEGFGGNDTLFGDDGNDTITGDSGNDVIDGGNGNDNLSGGSGVNTVSYAHDTEGVTVDLSSGMGFATGVDTLVDFQNITGSQFDDTLTGDAGPNVIDGLGGTDVCTGNGGTDTLLHCP
jgi:Ca2+-binding RTX toxin-like protein